MVGSGAWKLWICRIFVFQQFDLFVWFVFLYICLPELKVCIYFSLKRLVFNSGGNFCCPNKLFLSILTEKEWFKYSTIMPIIHTKNKNLAPWWRWTMRLYSGNLFISLFFSAVVFFPFIFYCTFKFWRSACPWKLSWTMSLFLFVNMQRCNIFSILGSAIWGQLMQMVQKIR